jgi:DNA-binding NtrC family response regulator
MGSADNWGPTTRMKPIWIVDDDQSIRFVLEKALLREQPAHPQFLQLRVMCWPR